MKRPRLPQQKTRLDANCKADINGGPCLSQTGMGFPPFPLLSQSLGSLAMRGCGAFDKYRGSWFQLPWPASWAEVNIVAKELLPVVVAAAVWGRHWVGQRVLFLSDNAAVVAALASRSAHHPILAHLLNCLFFWEAKFSIQQIIYLAHAMLWRMPWRMPSPAITPHFFSPSFPRLPRSQPPSHRH